MVFELYLDRENQAWLSEVRKGKGSKGKRQSKEAVTFKSEPAWLRYKNQHPKADPKNHTFEYQRDAKPEAKPSANQVQEPASKSAPKSPRPRPETKSKPGTSRVEIDRTEYKTVPIPESPKHTSDDSETSTYGMNGYCRNVMEANGMERESRPWYAAKDWAYSWINSTSEDSADEFIGGLHEKGTWQNLKYSATQTYIEAKKEEFRKRGIMDADGMVTLYRGVVGKQAEQLDQKAKAGVRLGVYGLSCWSEDPSVAMSFADKGLGKYHSRNISRTKVHYSRIVAMWESEDTNWKTGEGEWTVLSENGKIQSEWVNGEEALKQHKSRIKTGASKTGAVLTKAWLMGVRRGFLSILPKTVLDFDQARKTFVQLSNFVHRLELQVTKIRRGPNTDVDNEAFKPFARDLKLLYETIHDAEDACRHWQSIHEGRNPLAQSDFDKGQAERQLELYRTNFPGALEHHVPTKGKGPGGTRNADIVEIFDKLMKHLFDAAKEIDKGEHYSDIAYQYWAEEVPIDFKVGGMTFVLVYDFKSGQLFDQYVREARAAYGKLKRWGLDRDCWYGATYVMDISGKKLTDEEKERYRRSGYDISSIGGEYSIGSNNVRMWSSVDSFQHVLLHELGHRYWFKNMSQEQRMQFIRAVWTQDHDKAIKPEGANKWTPRKEAEPELRKKWKATTTKDIGRFYQDAIQSSKRFTGWYDMFTQAIAINPHAVSFYFMDMDALFKEAVQFGEATGRALYESPEYRAYSRLKDEFGAFHRNQRTRLEALRDRVDPGANGASPIEERYRDELDAFILEGYRYCVGVVEQIDNLAWGVIQDYLDVAYKTEGSFEAVRNRMVEPVSDYGKTNPDEAWAEAFMHLVGGRDMSVAQIRIMLDIIKGTKRHVHRVLARFLAR